jgi:hypothetical protein
MAGAAAEACAPHRPVWLINRPRQRRRLGGHRRRLETAACGRRRAQVAVGRIAERWTVGTASPETGVEPHVEELAAELEVGPLRTGRGFARHLVQRIGLDVISTSACRIGFRHAHSAMARGADRAIGSALDRLNSEGSLS